MLEDKETYTLRELIESLPYSLRQFGKDYKISEVTIARIRDGKPAIRSTINRLLTALSAVYGKKFTTRNVQGIIIRGEGKNGEDEPQIEASAKPQTSGATTTVSSPTEQNTIAEERPWYLPEQKEESTEDKSEPSAA